MYNLFVESDHYCLYQKKKYEIHKLILFIYENQHNKKVVELEKIKVTNYRDILGKACWVLSKETLESLKQYPPAATQSSIASAANNYLSSNSARTITPQLIINNPEMYNAEYQKILSADIMFPIVMIRNHRARNHIIFDGHHRLVKALQFNVPSINAYIINDMRALDDYFGHTSQDTKM